MVTRKQRITGFITCVADQWQPTSVWFVYPQNTGPVPQQNWWVWWVSAGLALPPCREFSTFLSSPSSDLCNVFLAHTSQISFLHFSHNIFCSILYKKRGQQRPRWSSRLKSSNGEEEVPPQSMVVSTLFLYTAFEILSYNFSYSSQSFYHVMCVCGDF